MGYFDGAMTSDVRQHSRVIGWQQWLQISKSLLERIRMFPAEGDDKCLRWWIAQLSPLNITHCICVLKYQTVPHKYVPIKRNKNKNNSKNLSRSVRTSGMIDVGVHVPGLGILLSFFFVSFYHKNGSLVFIHLAVSVQDSKATAKLPSLIWPLWRLGSVGRKGQLSYSKPTAPQRRARSCSYRHGNEN